MEQKKDQIIDEVVIDGEGGKIKYNGKELTVKEFFEEQRAQSQRNNAAFRQRVVGRLKEKYDKAREMYS